MTSIASSRCRVRIVNDIDGHTTVVESPRDRSMVVFDLMKMVKAVNRRRDETVKASLHLLPDWIVLHWHCPWIVANDLAADLLEVAKPVHEVESLIVKGGQQA
jgi:hypothetical protein